MMRRPSPHDGKYLESDKANVKSFEDNSIIWSSSLEQYLAKGIDFAIEDELFKKGSYRPFIKQYFYYDRLAIHRVSLNSELFGKNLDKELGFIFHYRDCKTVFDFRIK